MDPLTAGLAGGNIIGGLWANRMNEIEGQRNRDFQSNMSSSAHQREVIDLKAAGLNPILSAGGGGSSTPSGAMPQYKNPFSEGASTALQGTLQKAQVDLIRDQQDKTRSDTAVVNASLPGVVADSTAKQQALQLQQLEIGKQEVLKYLYGKGGDVLKKLDPAISKLLNWMVPSSSSAFSIPSISIPSGSEMKDRFIEGIKRPAPPDVSKRMKDYMNSPSFNPQRKPSGSSGSY